MITHRFTTEMLINPDRKSDYLLQSYQLVQKSQGNFYLFIFIHLIQIQFTIYLQFETSIHILSTELAIVVTQTKILT